MKSHDIERNELYIKCFLILIRILISMFLIILFICILYKRKKIIFPKGFNLKKRSIQIEN